MNNLITESVNGKEIKFKTSPGVFSKDGLDKGTRLLLESGIELEDRSVVVDLGAGAGTLGIVLAKMNPRVHVHLLEDHLSAMELATENVELNKLRNVEVYSSNLFSAVQDRTYHQIFSNPPQHLGNELLAKATKECFLHLKKGGLVWWVIQAHLKNEVEKLFEAQFGSCEIITKAGKYVVLRARRK